MSTPVDIIIVSYNTRDLLRACLDSARAHASGARAIVVDNASTDGSPEMVATEFPEVTLLRSAENLGFGGANNLGIAAGDAPLLLFLNSDAALTPGALERLVTALEAAPEVVMAGPRLVYPDGRFQRSCRRIPNAWRYAWSLSGLCARMPWVRPLDTWYNEAEHRPGLRPGMLSGACFLARRDYLASIANFDPRLFLYEEETDLAIPARKRGLRCIYVPESTVQHHGGASTGEHVMSAISEHHLFRSKYLVFDKHYGKAHARLAFWLDTAVLGAAARRQARRGGGTAAQSLARCQKAFADYEQVITSFPYSL